jgi:hypothetical protein
MSNYNIKRWDPVTSDGDDIKPMIYIEPDITFLEFVKANNFNVLCEISGTDTCYDKNMIVGIVNKSSNVPNCRPNFYNKTGLYVITLDTTWVDYPKFEKLGTVKFYGLKEPLEVKKLSSVSTENTTNDTKEKKDEKLKDDSSSLMLFILFLSFAMFFIYLFF